jgi:hypothetical protein
MLGDGAPQAGSPDGRDGGAGVRQPDEVSELMASNANPWDEYAVEYGQFIARREQADLERDAILCRMLDLLGDLSGREVAVRHSQLGRAGHGRRCRAPAAMVCTTAPVRRSKTLTLASSPLATKARPVRASTATAIEAA